MEGNTVEMMSWYEDYQQTELEIRQRARRNRKLDIIEDFRAVEIRRKLVGYTMLTCLILFVGSVGTLEISEVPSTGAIWICILSQVILYTLAFAHIRAGRKVKK